jgi:hypothetical protein
MDVPDNEFDSGRRNGAPGLRGRHRAPRAPAFARRVVDDRSAPAAGLGGRRRA